MSIEILSDLDKLEKWNDICMIKGWSRPGELQAWILVNGIKFTPSGSILAPNGLTLKVLTPDMAKELSKAPDETMATHILSVYCGLMVFVSAGVEAIFWKGIIERMSSEFNTFMPPELVPKYIRDLIKYPEDGDGSIGA